MHDSSTSGILLIVIVFGFYFFPTIIAIKRGKANVASIALVNLFLGWTFIGWIVALVWAVSKQVVDAPVVRMPAPARPRLCAHCGQYSEASTPFCPHCGKAA